MIQKKGRNCIFHCGLTYLKSTHPQWSSAHETPLQKGVRIVGGGQPRILSSNFRLGLLLSFILFIEFCARGGLARETLYLVGMVGIGLYMCVFVWGGGQRWDGYRDEE
ncbi:hypothetical protein CEXT_127801 [Caerostris extrusa]|uniref:Uncharacterized protein n=1 Tax=Caerostris extrusa TaxID=172846 RepID=A0AAV4TGK3_CAEEX|nr:hypothetical protein CEXT_127801 [Caerostris extrusa]